MPLFAPSNFPTLVILATVKAPFSAPKSSTSDNGVVISDHIIGQGVVPFDMIKHLIRQSKLTTGQLNYLQQLIDSNR